MEIPLGKSVNNNTQRRDKSPPLICAAHHGSQWSKGLLLYLQGRCRITQ